MTFEEYRAALEECGWLEWVPPADQRALLDRIRELIEAGSEEPHAALAVIFDEAMDPDGSWQDRTLQAVTLRGLQRYAAASAGVFTPSDVRWDGDRDEGELSFSFKGETFTAVIGWSDDDEDEGGDGGLRALINAALRKTDTPQRFIELTPFARSHPGYAFVPPSVYRRAFGRAIPETTRNPITGAMIRIGLRPDAQED